MIRSPSATSGAPPEPIGAPGARPRAEVRIANRATYWPVAPLDLVLGAPLVVRLLLGASPVARVVQAAALGAYLASAARDWRDRRAIRRIDFRREFGADLDRLVPMPRDVREAEVRALAGRLNDEFTERRRLRRELAVEVDRHLTSYVAGITGQHVWTSVEVRDFTLARLAMPSALGMCDVLSGDIAIFQDTGPFEPHILAHELCHRKGYWKELHAQVLAYLALTASADPELEQSARLERVYRSLRVLSGGDQAAFERLVGQLRLRPELRDRLLGPRRPSGAVARGVDTAVRRLYDARMRLTGQNGISDYDLGFTNFLYTFETSATARQRPR
ncbi:MAG TPA: DUF3810 family protein [Candidatus Binatia bacterium]|nr:DUF3810 family protein [Candidatus Binatia bacterium]